MEKKLKIYLDTSVINFLFADDAPQFKDITLDFFENYLNVFDVYISQIVIDEINKTGDADKRLVLMQSITNYNLELYNRINQTIVELAKNYIDFKIIPQNKFEDALHLAFASYYEFDILLSWNFKHLANINKQEKINSFNLNYGYRKPLLLLNPMEVVYEND
ncbi:MAG: type II toxin-antitoxin system VapC family toxin [bacterium]